MDCVVLQTLSCFITGVDWVRLTSACKWLRAFSGFNRRLCVTLHRKTRKAPQFPRGTTFATISQKLLPRLFHMPSTLKNLVITSVYTDYKNLRFPEGLRSLSIQNKGDPSSVHSWMFPSSLRVLKVWEMPCDTKLPDSIFSLTVMDSMISPPNPVKYTLPCMLTFLDLGPWSDVSPLDFDMPDTLQVLLLPYFFIL